MQKEEERKQKKVAKEMFTRNLIYGEEGCCLKHCIRASHSCTGTNLNF